MKIQDQSFAFVNPLDRRAFLRRLFSTGVSSAAFPLIAAPAPGTRVAIIGAGMAGLAAADRLASAGIDTIVVEARDRVGGRIWTAAPGVDLGASWIHGANGNPLLTLATASGTGTALFNWDKIDRFEDGEELSQPENAAIERLYERLENYVLREGRRAGNSVRLSTAIQRFKKTLPASDRSYVDYVVNSNVTHEYAADPQRLSLAWFDEGVELRGGDYLLPNGYAGLFNAFQAPGETRLSTPVRTIRHGLSDVTLVTDSGDITADAAIVTIPLGVLKRGLPTFDPPLGGGHATAIQLLGMGTLNKIYLRFPRIVWPRKTHAFGRIGQDRLWEEWVNLVPSSGQPALVGFNAGQVAESSENQSDQKLIASAVAALREMFGKKLPAPVAASITRWHRDPWAGGSYSSLPPRSTPNERRLLAAPVHTRLLFAGEACSVNHPATVRGAYETGVAAADQLLASLP